MDVRRHKLMGVGKEGWVQLPTVLTRKVLGGARMSCRPQNQPHLSVPPSNPFSPLNNPSGVPAAYSYAQLGIYSKTQISGGGYLC